MAKSRQAPQAPQRSPYTGTYIPAKDRQMPSGNIRKRGEDLVVAQPFPGNGDKVKKSR